MFLLSILFNRQTLIFDKKYTSMEIQSMTHKEIVYETTLEKCSCPDFRYRKSVNGGMCKHIKHMIKESFI